MPRGFDVAVVGGGVGGAACALQLARSGAAVVLFERETEPRHKVCGEFLSAEGLRTLAETGVDLDAIGASRIARFRLHGPRLSAESLLPAECRGLSRLRLDESLIAAAAAAGVQVVRGWTVRASERNADAFEIPAGNDRFFAKDLVCATGKADFGGTPRREGRDGNLVGFKFHLELAPAAAGELTGHVELFAFAGGYAGLCAVEGAVANLCFLLDRALAKEVPKSADGLCAWISLRHRELRRRLFGAVPRFEHPVTIARVPYGFVRRRPLGARMYCIGDQAAVIPSLTGDGMTIALVTARQAARFIAGSRGCDRAAEYHAELARFAAPQIGFGYRLHQAFRVPSWIDAAAGLVRLAPRSVAWAFRKTRVPLWAIQNHQSSGGSELFTGRIVEGSYKV